MSDRDALIAALSPDTVIAPEHMAEALYLARQEAIRLTGDRDRLASLLEKLRPYLRHDDGCLSLCSCGNLGLPHPCDCDLADLLTEMENG